jgi:hypothetical protein
MEGCMRTGRTSPTWRWLRGIESGTKVCDTDRYSTDADQIDSGDRVYLVMKVIGVATSGPCINLR